MNLDDAGDTYSAQPRRARANAPLGSQCHLRHHNLGITVGSVIVLGDTLLRKETLEMLEEGELRPLSPPTRFRFFSGPIDRQTEFGHKFADFCFMISLNKGINGRFWRWAPLGAADEGNRRPFRLP